MANKLNKISVLKNEFRATYKTLDDKEIIGILVDIHKARKHNLTQRGSFSGRKYTDYDQVIKNQFKCYSQYSKIWIENSI